jgi:uncharacterized membrane protein YgcG
MGLQGYLSVVAVQSKLLAVAVGSKLQGETTHPSKQKIVREHMGHLERKQLKSSIRLGTSWLAEQLER